MHTLEPAVMLVLHPPTGHVPHIVLIRGRIYGPVPGHATVLLRTVNSSIKAFTACNGPAQSALWGLVVALQCVLSVPLWKASEIADATGRENLADFARGLLRKCRVEMAVNCVALGLYDFNVVNWLSPDLREVRQ